jgi:hypothetical protein
MVCTHDISKKKTEVNLCIGLDVCNDIDVFIRANIKDSRQAVIPDPDSITSDYMVLNNEKRESPS